MVKILLGVISFNDILIAQSLHLCPSPWYTVGMAVTTDKYIYHLFNIISCFTFCKQYFFSVENYNWQPMGQVSNREVNAASRFMFLPHLQETQTSTVRESTSPDREHRRKTPHRDRIIVKVDLLQLFLCRTCLLQQISVWLKQSIQMSV